MPILAEQHREGGWKSKADPYAPICQWPEDCLVQWGSNGVVVATPSYVTAFFEAFPVSPKTFIRGEGKDVAEAEKDAFSQFQKQQLCTGHEFERRGYKNGAGFCKNCDLFKSHAFEPLETCCVCQRPTFYAHVNGHWFCENDAPKRIDDDGGRGDER